MLKGEDFYDFYEQNQNVISDTYKQITNFQKQFNLDYIQKLTLDDYCVGFGNNGSYCSELEKIVNNIFDTELLSSFKFGVFYSQVNEDYKYTSIYPNEDNVFNLVKEYITNVISYGEYLDDNKIVDPKFQPLHPVIRAKILYLYNPAEFIPIFDKEETEFLYSFFDNIYQGDDDFLNVGRSVKSYFLHFLDKKGNYYELPEKVMLGIGLFLKKILKEGFKREKSILFTNRTSELNINQKSDISVYMQKDNWNDFGYRTMYNLTIREKGTLNGKIEIGSIKVMGLNKDSDTQLTFPFFTLDNNFASFANYDKFYLYLLELGKGFSMKVLNGLNDLILKDESFISKFRELGAFHTSLLREGNDEDITKCKEIFFNISTSLDSNIKNTKVSKELFEASFLKLLVEVRYINSINRLNLNFDFSEDNFNFFRINAIIGKNGVGKSTSLLKLCRLLCTVSSDYKETVENKILDDGDNISASENEHFFSPYGGIGGFSQVIYISYDLFNSNDIKTAFLGYSKNGSLCSNDKTLKERLEDLIHGKSNHFLDKVRKTFDVLELPNLNSKLLLENPEYSEKLSSGYKMLLSTIIDIITNISPKSLILFDEPETHLHPEFIGILIKLFNELLDEFNSYMIIGTHSPIIIQQIPSKYITKIVDNGTKVLADKLSIESFGNNISEIIYDVFGSDDDTSFYKSQIELFKKKGFTRNEILDFFNNKLSLNMRLFLDTIYNQNEKDSN